MSNKVVYMAAIYSCGNMAKDESGSLYISYKDIIRALLEAAPEDSLRNLIRRNLPPPKFHESESLANWMLAARSILKLNQTEFGQVAGLTQSDVSNIESNSGRVVFGSERLQSAIQRISERLQSDEAQAA